MRINRITLYNFGSYEGLNIFDTNSTETKNIILIGGKNGAGKTTLFTAMRLCLYGYKSEGYKSANSYYNKAIVKLINNNAKIEDSVSSYVEMSVEITNGREIDSYTLKREWTLSESLVETFTMSKNGEVLEEDEIADFEKFLMSLIPPELFNLYFFDGEKIADFFMDEGGNKRIKEAFLILCGYDTFEIMRNNFKRNYNGADEKEVAALNDYILAKKNYEELLDELSDLRLELSEITSSVENCDSEIIALEKDYSSKGGITQEEWSKKTLLIKEEEKKREVWNAELKKWANDVVPFIMIHSLLESTKEQIIVENNNNKLKSFEVIINTEEVSTILKDKKHKVEEVVNKMFGSNSEPILGLSFEQESLLMTKLSDLLSFDKASIEKNKKLIKASISRTARIRNELDNSSVANAQKYVQSRSELFEKKSELLDKQIKLEQSIASKNDELDRAVLDLTITRDALERKIKSDSINDISARAIIMLDNLQAILYKRQIEKIENEFRHNITILMRKERFIDDIYIDDDFNIHVYRNEEIEPDRINYLIANNSKEKFISLLGLKALKSLNEKYGKIQFTTRKKTICGNQKIIIPVELDKSSFSNGEKQIFIMALYNSLVRLGNHEIPFVIDTPFARIDTEHRNNIAKYFFMHLKGQVFILSTNEEITVKHVGVLSPKIYAKYTLENNDNKKTVLIKDKYFEE